MIFGKKSDLKSHLSVKRPTWAHKVVVHGEHEINPQTEPQEESPLERDSATIAQRSEPIQPR